MIFMRYGPYSWNKDKIVPTELGIAYLIAVTSTVLVTLIVVTVWLTKHVSPFTPAIIWWALLLICGWVMRRERKLLHVKKRLEDAR